MTKDKTKTTTRLSKFGSDIMNFWLLLTVISAVYAIYVIAMGTEGIVPKVMVVPLAVTTAYVTLRKFTK